MRKRARNLSRGDQIARREPMRWGRVHGVDHESVPGSVVVRTGSRRGEVFGADELVEVV